MSKTSGGGYAQPSETGPVITSRVTAEPAQYIPCSTGTSSSSCTFCGETGITFPHTCKVSDINKIPDLTNRFDPYEALDTIIERVEDIEEQNHETPDVMACIGRLADIRGEVRALRAYITGMEQ